MPLGGDEFNLSSQRKSCKLCKLPNINITGSLLKNNGGQIKRKSKVLLTSVRVKGDQVETITLPRLHSQMHSMKMSSWSYCSK